VDVRVWLLLFQRKRQNEEGKIRVLADRLGEILRRAAQNGGEAAGFVSGPECFRPLAILPFQGQVNKLLRNYKEVLQSPNRGYRVGYYPVIRSVNVTNTYFK